ncbi:uncharacterized protein K444DRAFT_95669 [Hyaloscypha bicolor E]|uniref:Uncharacterized protein n=1 Tax=Hyaloscypha bicolor E TaxID=1095630 RepID=A0A2J6SW87_9HELO|nr:uncharacterized protein K444DRAFT_95669 [Hyaloscypha bicolor E]PMD55047.1 hypothetical protein K444DRAFT_95669 [Hyaloscypha bicolor E]
MVEAKCTGVRLAGDGHWRRPKRNASRSTARKNNGPAPMEVPTTSNVDADECFLLSTSADFEFVRLRKAQQCNKASQNVVLQKIGDPNALPFIHITLVFMQHIFKAIYSSCTIRQTAISANPDMLQACGLRNIASVILTVHFNILESALLTTCKRSTSSALLLTALLPPQCWARKCFENTSRASPMTPCKLCV